MVLNQISIKYPPQTLSTQNHPRLPFPWFLTSSSCPWRHRFPAAWRVQPGTASPARRAQVPAPLPSSAGIKGRKSTNKSYESCSILHVVHVANSISFQCRPQYLTLRGAATFGRAVTLKRAITLGRAITLKRAVYLERAETLGRVVTLGMAETLGRAVTL